MYETSDKMKKHLEEARKQLDLKYPDGSWRNNNGATKKDKEVMYWRKMHPNGSKSECKKDTGMCYETIRKYWNYDFENFDAEQYLIEKEKREKEKADKQYRKGHGGRRIIYHKGDVVGDNGVIYLQETDPYITPCNGNGMRRAIFKCPFCGKEFISLISNVKTGAVVSCGCKFVSIVSKGEQKICEILEENNIKFEREKIFKDFISNKNNQHYRYDFYLPDYNVLIEYDGEHHYKKSFENGRYEETIENDEIKNQYAKKHDIKLIRIPYTDYKNLNLEYIMNLVEKS